MLASHNMLARELKMDYLTGKFFKPEILTYSELRPMPISENEPTISVKRLAIIGLPTFMIALVLSLLMHRYAHVAVLKQTCGGTSVVLHNLLFSDVPMADCPVASLAGPVTTFLLGLASFAVYMRFPRSLFWASMAFINASIRIPETVSVFFQLLFRQRSDLSVDENVALRLLHVHDPALGIVILCFLSITLLSLTIIIVHDTRMVPSKWLVAGGLFVFTLPLETILWRLIVPILA